MLLLRLVPEGWLLPNDFGHSQSHESQACKIVSPRVRGIRVQAGNRAPVVTATTSSSTTKLLRPIAKNTEQYLNLTAYLIHVECGNGDVEQLRKSLDVPETGTIRMFLAHRCRCSGVRMCGKESPSTLP
jgi:hypothetical protein